MARHKKAVTGLVNELAAQLDFAKDPNILVFTPLGGLGPIDIVTLNMTTGEYTAYDVKTKNFTAIRKGIDNNPNADQIEKLKLLCENILQPVRDHFGRVKVTSGFRSVELCEAIGSSARSQHAKAEAADFEVVGTDNAELFDWIKDNLEPDQMILEFYTPGEPNSGWIHCSWIPEGRRASYLHAYKSEGKTKYKPILGSAREIV
jgi:hypothetical protein